MSQPDISKTLLIDGRGEPLKQFRDFYNESVKDKDGDGKPDNQVVLLRFAQTDFMRLPVMAYNNHTGTNLDKQYGKSTYVVQESMFFNFDILELTFNREGVYTVIPVVNDPLDIINDIQLPEKEGGELLKYVLMLIGLILLIVLLPWLIKIIVWLISLPFKAISAISNRDKSSSNARKSKRADKQVKRSFEKWREQTKKKTAKAARKSEKVDVEKLKNDIWSGKKSELKLTETERYALIHDEEWLREQEIIRQNLYGADDDYLDR